MGSTSVEPPESWEQLELQALRRIEASDKRCNGRCTAIHDLLKSEIQNLRLEIKERERQLETRLQEHIQEAETRLTPQKSRAKRSAPSSKATKRSVKKVKVDVEPLESKCHDTSSTNCEALAETVTSQPEIKGEHTRGFATVISRVQDLQTLLQVKALKHSPGSSEKSCESTSLRPDHVGLISSTAATDTKHMVDPTIEETTRTTMHISQSASEIIEID